MAEPVSLTEAKAQCRMVEDDSEDTFITSLIAPARAFVEKVTTYSLVSGTRTFTFAEWGDFLEIYLRPITSLDSVTYTDENGDTQTLTGMVAPVGRFPFRVYPPVDDEFPDLLENGGIVTVELTTAALDSSSPEYLIAKRCVLLVIGHWFEFREAAQAGVVSGEIAFAITSMLDVLRPVSAY